MPRRLRSFIVFRSSIVVAVGLALACCTVSPQPIPPAGPTDAGVLPIVDAMPLLVIDPALLDGTPNGDRTRLSGKPGAVVPGGAALDIVNLVRDVAATSVVVASDGSFEALVPLAPLETARLTAGVGTARSAPVDVIVSVVGDGPSLVPGATTLSECLQIGAPGGVDFGTVVVGASPARRDVTLVNHCTSAVTIGSVALRPTVAGFAVASGSQVIPIDGTATVTVTFAPTAAGFATTNLALTIAAPAGGLRALAVSGIGQ